MDLNKEQIQKWEYTIEEFFHGKPVTVQTLLNKMGQEGWELVPMTMDGHLVFKRPITNSKPPTTEELT